MLVHPGPPFKRTPGLLLLPFAMFIITLVILALATLLYLAMSAEAASGARRNISGVDGKQLMSNSSGGGFNESLLGYNGGIWKSARNRHSS